MLANKNCRRRRTSVCRTLNLHKNQSASRTASLIKIYFYDFVRHVHSIVGNFKQETTLEELFQGSIFVPFK